MITEERRKELIERSVYPNHTDWTLEEIADQLELNDYNSTSGGITHNIIHNTAFIELRKKANDEIRTERLKSNNKRRTRK